MKEKKQKIWDMTFKTLLLETPKLFLPLIKEVFGIAYSKDCAVTAINGEFYSENGLKIISDVAFQIQNKIYHFECQFSNDKTMAFRMFQYDFFIAAVKAGENSDFTEFHFPRSCVIYITNNKNNPEKLEMKVDFPDGQVVVYKVPAIRVQDYSIEEIDKKELELFTPFLILRYVEQLKNVKRPTEDEIYDFYKRVIQLINHAYDRKQLDDLEAGVLIEAIKNTEEYVLDNYPTYKKGVDTMLAETLELQTVKAMKDGIEKGIEKGIERGRQEGVEQVIQAMLENGLSCEQIANITGIPLVEVRKMER